MRPQKSSARETEQRRDRDMIYCIESPGKTTEDTENTYDEQPEGG